MNRKVLSILEYNKILEKLSECASSEPGKRLCINAHPEDVMEKVTELLDETEAAIGRLLKNGRVIFNGNRDVSEAMLLLDKGSSLECKDLLRVAELLENTATVKSYGKDEGDEYSDALSKYFEELEPLSTISKEIMRCIISEDEIADDASYELKSIRRSRRIINDRIHSQLNGMVNNTYRTYLQDAVITMRDGRYCIPVKAEYKSMVPGMVHDQSQSFSTFFIEPSAIVELNNELRETDIREVKEIERILASLSASVAAHTGEIRNNCKIMTLLDYIFARGNLALLMKASRPEYNNEGIINLKKVRHPLLPMDKVVPIDIRLGDDFDLLIITGPNTGGKTVAIKTLGLMCLMGQTGMFIPAVDHSELSIFNEIFADIGDEQSIEQNLSTFSSHMKTIVEIMKKSDRNSLCLFDELGAGTDPTEGAALAISILDKLHQNHIRTVATTHYSELKVYALTEEGVSNACCEFDVDTLSPTYRLLIGVPGKSNAFAISSKLGLDDSIIENARKRLSTKDENFEEVLSELEKNRVLLEEEKLTVETYKKEIERLKTEYETKKEKLERNRDKILDEAKSEAAAILRDAKDSADESIRNFNKYGTIQEMEKQRTSLRKKLDKVSAKSNLNEKKQVDNKLSDFKIGEDVRIISMGAKGTVSSIPDSKGNLFVQCGIMRMQANMNDIEFLHEDTNNYSKKKKKMAVGGYGSFSKSASMSMELNLIGQKVDEAIPKLEKYLDDAYLSHLETVRIVHGKGTGALRNAVWNRLKTIKYVKSYKLAEYGEGDAGVTVVTFK